ncbi:MAG TPA: GNAT family N-acetyltransferase [Bdellovibrionota bacterium]|jgi:RimJ/RimL family protein N-acetyltransferase|nr:GNAT family N-acetyltransferase [Bdellovibrionota bacterium]
MNLHIRSARESDAAPLCEAERYWASQGGYLISQPEELLVDAFSKKIHSLTHHPNAQYVVLENEHHQLLGHALLEPLLLKALAHTVRLSIVIHYGNEGKGLGGVLLKHLIDWAKGHQNIEKVELLVRATNHRAIQLYESFGFLEEGRHRKRVKVGNLYLDDIAMGLFVKPSAALR